MNRSLPEMLDDELRSCQRPNHDEVGFGAAGETALPGRVSGQIAALPEGVRKAMLLSKAKMVLTGVLLAVLGLGTARMTALVSSRSYAAGEGGKAAKEKPTVELSLAEFKELKPILDIKNQPWTTIPWKYSITEARKLAAATKKPIFMVVNTGNCLGCT
jgi:hypothetical protein